MVEAHQMEFNDRMNAGAAKFELTYSSIWHLLHPGEQLRVSDTIVIERSVLLVDVSKYQGEIDFDIMRESGVEGVIIKCGQGLARDPYYVINMARAKRAGLPRGTYWYYDSRVAPDVQAYWWWQWIQDDSGELMHFADYEENYNGKYAGWENFYIFLAEFKKLSGLPSYKIGIYTGYYYWLAHSPTDPSSLAWFLQFALWLAWYTDNPAIVIIPRPWTNLTFVLWQYGTPVNGVLRGVQSLEIDENNFNGTRENYVRRFDLLPLPPGETDMTIFTGTAKSTADPNVRIRKPFPDGSLDVAGLTIYGIQPSQAFKGDGVANDSQGRQWVHVIEVGGTPVNGWSAGWYLNYTVPTEPPPDPEPEPTPLPELPYTITLGDDVTYTKVVLTGKLTPK